MRASITPQQKQKLLQNINMILPTNIVHNSGSRKQSGPSRATNGREDRSPSNENNETEAENKQMYF